MKVKMTLIQKTSKAGAELILEIFWFEKFSATTRYRLLIPDHGYCTNNGKSFKIRKCYLNNMNRKKKRW
ncbi:hypothetical protein HanRHA438_Chr15g0685821 [Helianthus annuus]|nr:hypothetical protein HanRHA438_Chr15g0685821 [Helianthus annuus]